MRRWFFHWWISDEPEATQKKLNLAHTTLYNLSKLPSSTGPVPTLAQYPSCFILTCFKANSTLVIPSITFEGLLWMHGPLTHHPVSPPSLFIIASFRLSSKVSPRYLFHLRAHARTWEVLLICKVPLNSMYHIPSFTWEPMQAHERYFTKWGVRLRFSFMIENPKRKEETI